MFSSSACRMSSSLLDIRQRLGGLNPSDGEYRRLLRELLSHQDLRSYIRDLQGSGLRVFVELLDNVRKIGIRSITSDFPRKALNHILVAEDLFWKTLHILRCTCSQREVLPSSYFIPIEALRNRGSPFAGGRFYDTIQAEFNGKRVNIKAFRSYAEGTSAVVNEVRSFVRRSLLVTVAKAPGRIDVL